MKRTFLGFSILVFGLTISGCVEKRVITQSTYPVAVEAPVHTPASATVPTPVVSQPLPPEPTQGESHQLKTLQGPMISIQERSNGFVFPQYQGKIVLLQLFGKDCHYCLEEMPAIQNMRRKYAQQLEVVGIHVQSNMAPREAQETLQRFQINYPVIDRGEASGLLYTIKNTYEWTGILPLILVMKDGVTEFTMPGKVTEQELDESIRSLM